MGSIFESAHPRDAELSVSNEQVPVIELKGKVVLVVGDSPLALSALKEAQDNGAKVVHASTNSSQGLDAKLVSVADYDSFVKVFQHTIDQYGPLDIVIAGFTMSQKASTKTAATTKTAVDAALKPMIHSSKLALYHFRRDSRFTKPRFVALVESADLQGISEPIEIGVSMAVLGMYRSAFHHWNAAGARFDLVITPASCSVHETALGVSAIFARPIQTLEIQSTIRLISQGELKTLPPTYGQLRRPPAYSVFDKRLRRLVYFKGSILNFKARHSRTVRMLSIVLPLGLVGAWWTEAFQFASFWAFVAGFVLFKAIL